MKHLKKILPICLLALALIVGITLLTPTAQAATSGDFTYTVTGGNATITGYTGTATELVIPETLDGYPVTEIGGGAFSGRSALQSLTIPNSVTKIGSAAFSGCSNLQSLTLPITGYTYTSGSTTYRYLFGYFFGQNSYAGSIATEQKTYRAVSSFSSSTTYVDNVTYHLPGTLKTITVTGSEILSNSFYNCASFENIHITGNVTTIGGGAFYECTGLQGVYISDIAAWCNLSFSSANANPLYFAKNLYLNGELLTDLVIPGSVTAISDYAFYGCESLQSVTLPDSLTTMGYYAFQNCTGLKSVNLGSGITGISPYAFAGCTGLESVTFGDRVTTIGSQSFQGCTGLQSVTIPDSVTKINGYTFDGCTGLQSVTLGTGITEIGSYTFRNCTSLQSVTIPDNVLRIQSYTFYGCESLQSVTVGKGVTAIDVSAFSGCENLQSVYISDVAAWCNISFTGYTANPLSYAKNLYLNGELVTNLTIPQGVTAISDYAFYNYEGLQSVTLPDSLADLGTLAFGGCSNITGFAVSETNPTFNSSNGLLLSEDNTVLLMVPGAVGAQFTFPEGVTEIGSYAFSGCANLQSLVVPDTITKINKAAFSGCSGLESITVPFVGSNPTSTSAFGYIFGTDEYAESYYAKSYYIPNSLKSVTITGGTILNKNAFQNLATLQSVTLPDNLTTIDEYAFLYCWRLKSITIPDSVTTIGNYAFSGCYGLKNITIPDSVTSIGTGALTGCTGLESIAIPFVGGSRKTATDTYQYPFGYIFGTSSYEDCTATKQFYYGSSTSSKTYSTYYIPNNLKSVTVTGGELLYGAFCNCAGLESVTVTGSISNVNSEAFTGCTGLQNVTLAGNITKLPEKLFYQHTGLEFVTFGDRVTTIGSQSFQGCTGLQEVSFPNSVTSISSSAFQDCTGLQKINFGNRVASIGNSTFKNCTGLRSITLPDSVTSIYAYAFEGCTGLRHIAIPSKVTTIDYAAFRNCTSLQSVDISTGVTKVNGYAFNKCTKLTDVYYAGTPAQWSEITIGDYNEPLLGATVHYSHTHDYSFFPPETVAPTCTEDGYIVYTCMYGDTYREYIPALGHDFNGTQTVIPPSCTEDGYTMTQCTRCSATQKSDYTDALGHDFNGEQTVVVNCTQQGSITTCCTRCTETETVYTDPAGHDFNGTQTVVGPTCTEQGYTMVQCTRCVETKNANYTTPLGHDFSGAQTVVPATCTETGSTTTQCIRCTETETVTVEALGHNVVVIGLCDPTCTQPGVSKIGTMCDRCQTVYVQPTYIPALGHSYVDGVCARCGDLRSDLSGDGVATNADVAMLAWHILFPEEHPLDEIIDFTGDGKTTNEDLIIFIWHVLFPEIYPLP